MDQEAKDWAEKHEVSLWEPTRKIEGQKGFGYPVHPYRSHRSVKLTRGLDNQWKRDTKTLVRRKSWRSASSNRVRRIDGSTCELVSSREVQKACQDRKVVEAQNKLLRIRNKPRRMLSRRERVQRTSTIAALQKVVAVWK